MGDFIATKNTGELVTNDVIIEQKNNIPKYENLKNQLAEASTLIEDVVLKNYLNKLTELEVYPFDEKLKDISDIRLFKINEMVYQRDEYSTYKFASVFNSVQNLNCGIFIIADSNGEKTNFYMGVRSLDNKRTTKSLKDTLKNSLSGQFPGVKTVDLLDPEAEEFLDNIKADNISSVSCVAKNKDDNFNENDKFLQGLEKLTIAMEGQKYTAIILAKSTASEQLLETRYAYEKIYTQLSPFANMQLSYGTNEALSISDAFSKGTTSGTSYSTNTSTQKGSSYSKNETVNQSVSKQDTKTLIAKSTASALIGVASVVTAPMTGGASIAVAGAILAANVGVSAITPKTETKGTSTSETTTDNISETSGSSESVNTGTSETETKTQGITSGKSDNMQLTMQNKTLIDVLERIDLQLKRIDECESLGMWECGAYFLSESQETAEMAAGTYKALMRGEKSGIETSAINTWGRKNKNELPILRDYITSFIHPMFKYKTQNIVLPVTASTLVSGNELSIQMGLPRKSVSGFPVIEHAEFGKEVVSYSQNTSGRKFELGRIFNMGEVTNTIVNLDCESLTMHTFITGSTGSGKSNTVYEILNQLRTIYNIPFLVIEPAKGEYKHVFGQFSNVTVYGTNPKKYDNIIKINPFRFPSDIHVLEHLDRLVEIFNVCWPMYAAMPAVLKEAMERAYISVGWDLQSSENENKDLFPNFADLLEQIENVINESKYSADSKGDYSGALCTRIRSLTNGLNGLIFSNDDLSDEDLFDKNVIVDLSRIGSSETKSLIMGILIMRLNEYRMCSADINKKLSHVTVLEEAHNILKRTSTEQSSEGSNLIGKSVEMLSNSIAEMRTYGEGFIIADQSPGLLDMSVIRNTNTKIILRLPEQSDRELVGMAASLSKDQISELSKLEMGVAAVYQNNWIEPVLTKVNKCKIKEHIYEAKKNDNDINYSDIKTQLINFLIQGRVLEKLDFEIAEIEKNIKYLNLSIKNIDFIDEQIHEYKTYGELSIWKDESFRKLARYVTDICEARSQVEHNVLIAQDYNELTDRLTTISRKYLPKASESSILTLNQCFMRDLSVGKDEVEERERLYMQWIDSMKKRGF